MELHSAFENCTQKALGFGLALVVLGLSACQASSEEASSSGSDVGVVSAPATASIRGSLPAQVEDGNCSEPERPKAPATCAWATSADAVVWGVLKEVRLVSSPAVAAWNIPGKDWDFATECDAVNPAMQLVIEVQRVLAGDKKLEGELVVHVGTRQREQFDPMPVLDADGALVWEKVGNSNGGALVVGQSIGAPLHYVPEYKLWSLMGESLFALDADAKVSFQERRGHCIEPKPETAAVGAGIEPFGRALAGCVAANPVSSARRARQRGLWGAAGQDPTAFMAASCFRKQPGPRAGECESASDCDSGNACVSGVCRKG
jgi:hypothetical protein